MLVCNKTISRGFRINIEECFKTIGYGNFQKSMNFGPSQEDALKDLHNRLGMKSMSRLASRDFRIEWSSRYRI